MTDGPSFNEYIARGWKVFPCHHVINGFCSCGDQNCDSPGKHPRTHNGVKAATDNVHQIATWHKQWPNANWGLATGDVSGVIVIDIDERKGGFNSFDEYEQTRQDPRGFGDSLIALTGGGGRHIYLQTSHPIRNRVNWLAGVDIRGDGGYVILPPGNHISGGVYSWLNWGTEPMIAPDDFIKAMHEGGSAGNGFDIQDLTVDDFIEGIEEGGRDDTIFRMACRLRRQMGDNRAAITALCLIAANNSKPPFSKEETLRKVDQAFRQDHTDLEVAIFNDPDQPLAHLTDMGNRDRFLQMFGDDYRFVVGMGWHKWADDGWHRVDEFVPHRDAQAVPDAIRDEAQQINDLSTRQRFIKWAKDSESAGKLTSIISLAKGHERIKKTVEDFDNDPWSLACANGMVDLRDGSIRSFTREDLFTKNTRIVYDRTFKHEKWAKFIHDVTDGDSELEEYLQIAAGYSLTGSIQEECFFIVSGPRQTGKSTFVTAIESAAGSYHQTTTPDLFMKRYGKDSPREELVKLAGARLVTSEEIPEGERFDDALLKRITGGSTLSARYLYQEAFDYVPQFKLWLATNFDPITSDSAMFRRIKRVPFLTAIPEERKDRTLKTFIRDRSSGAKAVLAWAIEGAIKYHESKRLVQPDRITMATRIYESEQDAFAHFMNETFDLVKGEKLAEVTIFQLYIEWAKRNNERQLKRPQFAQKLREKGFQLIIDEITQTRYVENLRVRVTNVFV